MFDFSIGCVRANRILSFIINFQIQRLNDSFQGPISAED